jgi:hypothetical protein
MENMSHIKQGRSSLLFLIRFTACDNKDLGKTARKPDLPGFSYSNTAEPLSRSLDTYLPGLYIKIKY